MAQIRKNGPELTLVDQKPSTLLALGSRGDWGGSDFHGLLIPALELEFACKIDRRLHAASSMELEDHDLIGQERMAIGQVEHGLLRQLLRVVRARASLEDDFLIRVNNMKVTNPAASGAVDVPLDKLGEFQMVLAEPEPPKLCCQVVHRHASLPI